MISVCTTVYRETDALEIFIRTLAGNASREDDWEVIVVNDEAYGQTNTRLEYLQIFYPQLKIVNFSKAKRIKHIKEMIAFYKKINIFDEIHIKEMEKTLKKYEKTNMPLWIPTPKKFNLAAKQAKGDILLFMPGDYFVFFDISDVYEKCQILFRERGRVYGHPAWVYLDGSDPDDILLSLRQEKNVRQLSNDVFVKAQTPAVPAQHGVRAVSKELYADIGGFDDRWFTRAIGEDIFNDKCRATWGSPYGLLDYPMFEKDPVYVGALSHPRKALTYLTPSYELNPAKHWLFVNKIKEWVRNNET